MSRAKENTAFTCLMCDLAVVPLSNGSYRNHCPRCLYSQHLDVVPGDRLSRCGGIMEPIGTKHRSGKGLQLVHRCLACGDIRTNRIAYDTAQPDDLGVLARLPAV